MILIDFVIINVRGDYMTNENISKCPICTHELTIKEYECKSCHTNIRGDFKTDNFSSLTKDQKDFVELFVMKRGSIKEIEKSLGVSYPTVRNMLDGVISSLGHRVDEYDSKMEILNRLNQGEITTDQATKLLEELKNKED